VTERSREAEADRQVNADNLRHFGEPVYEYDRGQGIEDGYLAACEIARCRASRRPGRAQESWQAR
jgi:type I restriction enzyme R subunit